jgi:hypothetical protein
VKLNSIPIPKRFWMFAEEYTVIKTPDLAFHDSDNGQARYRENTILIQDDSKGWARKKDQQEQTFFHELLHHAVARTNKPKLSEDDIFIDGLAGLLHQAFATAEYK